jgi:hypothetical protein
MRRHLAVAAEKGMTMDLIERAKKELRQIQLATYFWIFLMVLAAGLGWYYERFEFKVIKAYQIFYFLAVFFVLAFIVERLERRKFGKLIAALAAKVEELSGKH